MTHSVQHIPRTADTGTPWPSPTDTAWTDPAEVRRLFHPHVHPVAQPGCDLCPPTPCRCGQSVCDRMSEHSRTWAGSETTVREMAA